MFEEVDYEIVYSTEDEEVFDWGDDRLDCGCCACCGCSCYDLEEDYEEDGYTYDAELPYIYMSVYFDSNMYPEGWSWTKATGGTELEGSWGWYEYHDDYADEELVKFLAKELGDGIFECLVQLEIEYYQCNHPLDPEEWDANCYFELLDWRRVNE